MALYEYENQLADLQNQYAQAQAAQEYGRFVGQQRFNNSRTDLDNQFKNNFGRLTGSLARRFGSNVRSGRIGADVGQYQNDYARNSNRMDTEYAGWLGNQETQAANGAAAYQGALARLMEQLKASQASENPFDPYQAVYGRS